MSSDEAPVQFDADTAMSVREEIPGFGHAIELRVYRCDGVLHLDWWYDTRRIESAVGGVARRAVPGALIELTREAIVGR